MEIKLFEKALSLNVNDKTEKKGNLTYLSWAFAWQEFKKIYPDGKYEIKLFDGLPYVQSDAGVMVYTSVTAAEETHMMWLPVMDFKNKVIKTPDMMEINKTIMRCLTKNLAMFGIGLYIYAGEDLPISDNDQKPNENNSNNQQSNTDMVKQSLELLEVKSDPIISAFGQETYDKALAAINSGQHEQIKKAFDWLKSL